jgi:hypothetical protein
MSIIEYARFLSDDGTGVATAEETEFVDKYQTDMEIQVSSLPHWFKFPSKKH